MVMAFVAAKTVEVLKETVIAKLFVLPAFLSASTIEIETANTSPPIAGESNGRLLLSKLVCTMKPFAIGRLGAPITNCPALNVIELCPAGSASREVVQTIFSVAEVIVHMEIDAPPEDGVKKPTGDDCPEKYDGGIEIVMLPSIINSVMVLKENITG